MELQLAQDGGIVHNPFQVQGKQWLLVRKVKSFQLFAVAMQRQKLIILDRTP